MAIPPPERSDDSADEIGHGITPIGGGVRHEVRPGDFAQQRPDNQMKRNLTERGSAIVVAPFKAALHPQHEGEGCRDEEQVIEVTGEKRVVRLRNDQPPIERVKRHRK